MTIFISWSGERSKKIAETFHEILEMDFPNSEPWMSSEDIQKGKRWLQELSKKLETAKFGIICLTPENLNAPWVLFEAGALAKTAECTVWVYLIDVDSNQIPSPLTQFQVTTTKRDDTKNLFQSINNALGNPIKDGIFDKKFQFWWSQLSKDLKLIKKISIPNSDILTMRGMPIQEAIKRVGLVDIENRNERNDYRLPPTEFYEKAQKEIVITGPTLQSTFHDDRLKLQELLVKKINIYTMILHPKSKDVERLTEIHGISIGDYLKNVIVQIKTSKLLSYPNFRIRFFPIMPPFQGVMIDGDIAFVKSGHNDLPNDMNGEVRVQPLTISRTIHSGLIVQLKKVAGNNLVPTGPFDSFAEDLRKQWQSFTIEDQSLFSNT